MRSPVKQDLSITTYHQPGWQVNKQRLLLNKINEPKLTRISHMPSGPCLMTLIQQVWQKSRSPKYKTVRDKKFVSRTTTEIHATHTSSRCVVVLFEIETWRSFASTAQVNTTPLFRFFTPDCRVAEKEIALAFNESASSLQTQRPGRGFWIFICIYKYVILFT